MNSKIFSWEFINLGINLGQAFEWKKQYIEIIKIPRISPQAQQPFIALVDEILEITKSENYNPKNPPSDLAFRQRELEAKIDELVFD
jgi:hypothetical protein